MYGPSMKRTGQLHVNQWEKARIRNLEYGLRKQG